MIALDLPGFGRTPAAGRGSGIASSTRALARFVRALDLPPVFLFGSSMGGMVAAEHAAAHPASVRGLVLADPALPPVGSPFRGVPADVAAGFVVTGAWKLGPAILRTRTDRLGAERMALNTIEYCTARPDDLDPAWVAATVEEFGRWSAGPDAAGVFSEACRSIVRVFTFPRAVPAPAGRDPDAGDRRARRGRPPDPPGQRPGTRCANTPTGTWSCCRASGTFRRWKPPRGSWRSSGGWLDRAAA